MFSLAYTLGEDDYTALNAYYFLNSPTNKIMRIAFKCLLPVIFFSISAFVFRPGMSTPFIFLIFGPALLLSIAWLLLFKHAANFIARQNVRKVRRQGSAFQEESISFKFSADNATIRLSNGKTKLPYSLFRNIRVGESAFYLFAGPNQAHIIPFRAFTNPEQRNAFLVFILDKIKANA